MMNEPVTELIPRLRQDEYRDDNGRPCYSVTVWADSLWGLERETATLRQRAEENAEQIARQFERNTALREENRRLREAATAWLRADDAGEGTWDEVEAMRAALDAAAGEEPTPAPAPPRPR